MQAAMNIIVTVRGARMAQAEMNRIATATRAVNAANVGAAASMGRMGGGLRTLTHGMERYGKNMQWVGRQIEYNFTLPIALATGLTTKWALENERAMTRMRKVYGDTSMSSAQLTDETEALGRAFRFLSDNYGVALSEVIDAGATWAQAGAENIAVANGVRASLELQVLGEMDLIDSTEALIAIQAQYAVGSDELRQIIADLNAVENETSVRMRDLVDAMQRGAGVAREAGVDHREYAAMVASMVPAAANATQAGNSLKTIITRVMAPTRQATEAMQGLGIATEDASWRNANYTERMVRLAEALDGVSTEQRTVALTHIAGRRQVSRMAVALRDVTNESGKYHRAMRATADPDDTMLRYQREMDIFLRSSPQGFKILTTQIRNYATEIGQQLIPSLLAALGQIRGWVRAFAELDPRIRNSIVSILLLIAVIGPLVRYLGSTVLLVTQFVKFFGMLGGVLTGIPKLFGAVGGALSKMGGRIAWVGTEVIGRFAGAVWNVFVVVWREAVLLAAKSMFMFGQIVFTVMAGVARTMYRVIVTQIIPYIMRWVALTSLAAYTMGASFLSTLLPALRTTIAGFAGFVAANVAAAATSARAWVVAVAVKVKALLFGLVPAMMAAANRALFFAGAMVASAATAARAWVAGLLPAIGRGLMALPALFSKFLAGFLPMLAAAGKAILTVLLGPWGLLIAAVGVVLYAFRDQVANAVGWVIDRWNQMPGAFAESLRAVVRIVRDAAVQVYEWLSYLNPFVRHSPSLVESVRLGVRIIAREYASLANIGSVFNSGLAALDRFKAATAKARREMRAGEVSKMRQDVVTVSPGAGGAFDGMVRAINALEGALVRVEREYQAQDRVVARWQSRLDSANRTLDVAQSRLERLRDRANSLGDALRDAQSGLDALANMPIQGMREMEDALWGNEMAQKELRLRMLELEDVHGPVDDLRRKMAALQGDIEMLSGQREDLRLAGAGSDVLAAYDSQIDAMKAAQRALMDAESEGSPVSEYEELNQELEKLRREAERMQLERDLEFDPLTRQIERMVDGYKEMPFDQIVSGITRQQAEVARLTAAYDQANAAVSEQERVVEQATRARDAIQARYDLEYDKLQRLGDAYSAIQQQLREMNAEMEGFASNAASSIAEAERAAREAEAARKAAAGGAGAGGAGDGLPDDWGDFDIPGGVTGLQREEGDIDDLIAQWAEEDLFQDVFGSFDLFEPLKEMWNRFTDWFADKWEAFQGWWAGLSFGGGEGIFDSLRGAWERVLGVFQDDGALSGLWAGIRGAVNRVAEALERVWGWLEGPLRNTWELFYNTVITIVDNIRNQWNTFWNNVGGNGGTFKKAMDNIGRFIEGTANVLMFVFEGVWAVITALWEGLLKIIEPIWNTIVAFIDAAMTFIRGLIETVLAVISGDWSAAWEGVKTMFQGIWDGIIAILRGAWDIIWGIFEGLWTFLKELWQRIYDWLIGNSIVPDIVNGIVALFQWLRDRAKAIWDAIRKFIVDPIKKAWDWLKDTWNSASKWLSDKWSAIRTTARTLWNALRDAVRNAIESARDRVYAVVNAVRTWLSDRWSSIRDTARNMWNALRDRVRDAINSVRTIVQNVVNSIRDWLSGRWSSIRDTAANLWSQLRDRVRDRINGMRDRVRDTVSGMVTWLSGRWNSIKSTADRIWGNMRDSIGRIWDNVKRKIRSPIASAVNVAVNPIIRGINRVASKVGIGSISEITIPQFHQGGVVGQGGTPRNLGRRPLMSDEELAVLRKGERVLTEDERALLEQDPQALLPEIGGPLSWAKSVASNIAKQARSIIAEVARPMVNGALSALNNITGGDHHMGRIIRGMGRRAGDAVLDWLKGADEQMPKAAELGSNPGYQKMWAAVRDEFSFARLTSGLRPGAITATGNPSYHGQGRAVDLAGRGFMNHSDMLKINKWIYEHYKGATKELIYSGSGSKQVHNGRDFFYSGITRQNHFDHVHWAMDNGGFLKQGWNQPIFNGTGRPEIVSPERLMRRIVREEVQALGGGGGDRVVNINGNLEFPNIKDGDDAEDFIRNIESLAGR